MTTTRRLATLVAALTLGLGLAAAPATAANTAPAAGLPAGGVTTMSPCGYYAWDSTAYYHHCGGGSIMIEIDDWGANSYRCISPWADVVLGDTWDIDGAWYVWSVDHC